MFCSLLIQRKIDQIIYPLSREEAELRELKLYGKGNLLSFYLDIYYYIWLNGSFVLVRTMRKNIASVAMLSDSSVDD